jgi:hypothetical protein
MSTDDSVQSCRDGDAREYLEKHRIVELLNNMTSQLIFHRPGKRPTLYIASSAGLSTLY